MRRGPGPRMGGPPLAAGAELQAPAREALSPRCCCSAFPSPAPLLLLTFQLPSSWHCSHCCCGHCTRQMLTPSVLAGAALPQGPEVLRGESTILKPSSAQPGSLWRAYHISFLPVRPNLKPRPSLTPGSCSFPWLAGH